MQDEAKPPGAAEPPPESAQALQGTLISELNGMMQVCDQFVQHPMGSVNLFLIGAKNAMIALTKVHALIECLMEPAANPDQSMDDRMMGLLVKYTRDQHLQLLRALRSLPVIQVPNPTPHSPGMNGRRR